jgi:hypothetical protein
MIPGYGHSLIALTFSGSIFNSFEGIIKLKNMSFVFIKEIFFSDLSTIFLGATFSSLISNVLSVLPLSYSILVFHPDIL